MSVSLYVCIRLRVRMFFIMCVCTCLWGLYAHVCTSVPGGARLLYSLCLYVHMIPWCRCVVMRTYSIYVYVCARVYMCAYAYVCMSVCVHTCTWLGEGWQSPWVPCSTALIIDRLIYFFCIFLAVMSMIRETEAGTRTTEQGNIQYVNRCRICHCRCSRMYVRSVN